MYRGSSYSSDFSFYIEDKPNLFDRNDKSFCIR